MNERPTDAAPLDLSVPCRIGTGTKHNQGYRLSGSQQLEHRHAWEQEVGPIPPKYEIHHACFNRACREVRHLECLTRAEHKARHAALYTHCVAGHPYDEANTYIQPTTGTRQCKACKYRRNAEQRARKRAKENA